MEIEKIDPTKNHYLHEFLIAFAAFDFIHLSCAIVLLVFAYLAKPIEMADAGICVVEIIFALLLISFVRAMSHHHKFVDCPSIIFTLGCMTASGSLLIPLGIEFPMIIEGDWNGPAVETLALLMICTICATLAFACFFFAVVFSEKKRIWMTLIAVALFSMIALAPAQFVLELKSNYSVVEIIFRCIKSLAPLCFAPLGLLLMIHRQARLKFFFDLD